MLTVTLKTAKTNLLNLFEACDGAGGGNVIFDVIKAKIKEILLQ